MIIYQNNPKQTHPKLYTAYMELKLFRHPTRNHKKILYTTLNIILTKVYGCIQDLKTKNWWLNIENKSIGYFPAALFSNMDSADQVGWGGRTRTSVGNPSPPMGSGYLPDDNFVHACYFRHVAFRTSSGEDYGPAGDIVQVFTDKENCFGAKYYGNVGEEAGYSLQFGGPGGICGD